MNELRRTGKLLLLAVIVCCIGLVMLYNPERARQMLGVS